MEQFKNYSLICLSRPKCLQSANKSASIHTNQILLSSNRLELNFYEVKLHVKSASFSTDKGQTSRLSFFLLYF